MINTCEVVGVSDFKPAGARFKELDVKEVETKTNKWWARFETFQARRATVFSYLFILHIYYPLKNYYSQNYDSKSAEGSLQHQPPASPLKNEDQSWCWQSFPRMWRVLVWYRILNSIYMVYVIIKNVYPALIEEPLRLMNLSKPPNCYLLGKFLPVVNVRSATAILFAFYHLTWRYTQVYAPCKNYMISTIYFLLLDDRDIANYYKWLEGQSLANAALGEEASPEGRGNQLEKPFKQPVNIKQECAIPADKRLKMFHDIMSVRVDERDQVIYKLRPNRTPGASRVLRRLLINMTALGIIIMIPLAVVVTLFILIYFEGAGTHRYLSDYPGCSPQLQELYDQNQTELTSQWLIHLRGHQTVATVVDILENIILWTESAMACVVSFPLTSLLGYDLILYWKYLDVKVDRMLEVTRADRRLAEGVNTLGPRCHQHCSLYQQRRDRQILELQMEWQDFIKQIKHSDAFVGDGYTDYVLIWFCTFGVFIYFWLSSHTASMPPVPGLTLIFIMCLVTALSQGLLMLHRNCLKTYTKFCSLMALDQSSHKMNFIQTLDYFTRQRTCFTLLRRQNMTATTYLTLVGWSFSCFFILGSVYRV